MSADLYIYTLGKKEDLDPEWLSEFTEFRGMDPYSPGINPEEMKRWSALSEEYNVIDILERRERVWIGQVSWSKFAYHDDYGWLPQAVNRVDRHLYQPRLLTSTLLTSIMVDLNAPNNSYFGKREYLRRTDQRGRVRYRPVRSEGLNDRRTVKRWLTQHVGEVVLATSD